MTHPIDQHVGKKIRALRHIRNLTQQQLADKIDVKFQQVQKYETGANRVSASRLSNIAAALDAPITAFFPDAGQDPAAPLIDPRLHQIAGKLDSMTPDQAESVINAMSKVADVILTHTHPTAIAAE